MRPSASRAPSLKPDMSAQPRTLLEDGLRAARAAGDEWYSIYVLDSLAQVALDHMDIESARRYWHECLALNRHLGETLGIPSILEGFARLASAQSEHRRALRLLGAAAGLRSEMRIPDPTPMEQGPVRLTLSRSQAALGKSEADSAWHEGTMMTLDEAIEYGMAGLSIRETQTNGWSGARQRERTPDRRTRRRADGQAGWPSPRRSITQVPRLEPGAGAPAPENS